MMPAVVWLMVNFAILVDICGPCDPEGVVFLEGYHPLVVAALAFISMTYHEEVPLPTPGNQTVF